MPRKPKEEVETEVNETGTDLVVSSAASHAIETVTNDPKALMAAMTEFADENSADYRAFLNFDVRSGVFTTKEDGVLKEIDPDDGMTIIVNVKDIRKRLTMWIDKEVKDTIEVPFTAKLPDPDTLPTHGFDKAACDADPQCRDGWQESHVYPVIILETGEQYDMIAGNNTMKKNCGNMVRKIGKEMAYHDINSESPVLEVSLSSFTPKAGGIIYFPVFDLVAWRDNDEPIITEEAVAEDEEVEEEPVQKKAVRKIRRRHAR